MSFDVLAPHYRWMEWFLAGEKLQRSRVAWLDEVRMCRNVLLVGEGHGRFLSECIRALPKAEITCVDASRGMLEQARNRCVLGKNESHRVHFVHAELPQWTPPNGKFDLIVTNFFFDCFTEEQLEVILPKLAKAAAPEARWLIAEFQEPATGWRRWRAKIILGLAYIFFQIVTKLPARRLASYENLMTRCGFKLEKRAISEWGLLTSDLWHNKIIAEK